MPHFEHTTIVDKPLEYVAAVLSTSHAGPLFAPSIFRISLTAPNNGQSADLTYERIRTMPSDSHALDIQDGRDKAGRDSPTHLAATFTGPGVKGRLNYRLVPLGDTTQLILRVEYEFTGPATTNLLESATTAHNDRQFAVHLTTVKELIEAYQKEFAESASSISLN